MKLSVLRGRHGVGAKTSGVRLSMLVRSGRVKIKTIMGQYIEAHAGALLKSWEQKNKTKLLYTFVDIRLIPYLRIFQLPPVNFTQASQLSLL